MNKETEDKILEFWKKNKIYEKVKEKNRKGEKFYFMDGPPYATGNIHMGTALNKIVKDIFMRAMRLQGKDVFDRPGYDTHGVPIEFKVEKEIGSKSKQDIERYGVEKFIKRCKEFATEYIDVMNEEFMDLGVWMDWKRPYLTLDDEYIEAVWYAFKKADEKNLLYLGKYPVHVCPRCETAVAFNEIEYGKQRDKSAYVKFPVNEKDVSLIIWTTTPWTLPANTGVMVNPEINYAEVDLGEKWIIAEDLVEGVMKKSGIEDYKIVKRFKGKEMEGWSYENPLSKNLKLNVKNGYKVVLSSRYVTTEEGTGLVHVAPGHGKEDFEVGKEYGLDMPSPVGSNGVLTEEAGKYAGKKAREVDKEIIEDLKKDGKIAAQVDYVHDYPLCWRDKSPLLMIAQPQWFLKISDIHKDLLKENNENNWVPDYMRLRMKAWLEGVGDWPVSRQRYWGTPLPIWYDPETGEKVVIGSLDELRKLSGKKEINLHKPGIDEIMIKGKNGRDLKRVPEVLDVWFDSGVSSWAALDFPREKEKFDRYWPADLNIEGKDQFRGWWNSQMILSQIAFGRRPFENIIVHGMVLDVGKNKMSKSLGNIVSPKEVIAKYGRDYIRYYFAKLSKGEDFAYDEREFKEIRKFFTILLNLNNFISQSGKKEGNLFIEDKWIVSRYNSLIKEVTEAYNGYKLHEAVQKLEKFLVEDLSRTYIQIIRERADEVGGLLDEIFSGFLKLISPICPFVSEGMWKDKGKEDSIFLSNLPKYDDNKIDLDLENKFETSMKIIELGLAERDREKVGLRWPLRKAVVYSEEKLDESLKRVIAGQLNLKEVESKKGKEIKVELDLETDEELETEGFVREISRRVQAERKKRGLNKEDKINLKISAGRMNKRLEGKKKMLMDRTGSAEIEFSDGKDVGGWIEVEIRDSKIRFNFE
ncbi:isoleucine--tRNA ligase [Candidatus Pacearchaeota archaeon CG_4_9_14_0_2_um_filter_39_13]|nr:isoleucine--tRNA ligase [Candidatus Pacearchaeota archaeon]OIO44019.1 MAG: isoleucine--tRNA ligase [Candidatus Pacearchaeota archaeon CG1_02_39_14]PJC45115.1 MAG: isoleucine--tRNA ligase [Candidatus Pacearchaeota archaeon CG_4_9_14_0_2_um_filter_39_13]